MKHKLRMADGKLYISEDDTIMQEQLKCLEKLYDFNKTRPTEQQKRNELLKDMFKSIGDNCYIEPPFHSNWGGKNVTFGDSVYANFGLTLVDDTDIIVGNRVKFGPNVVVATAGHPILPSLREQAYQFNRPVKIGDNVWIGAGAVILPGITIGNNSVVGAGSVVTKDVPDNVIAVGNPCKVLREIGERDKNYFYKNEAIDWENL